MMRLSRDPPTGTINHMGENHMNAKRTLFLLGFYAFYTLISPVSVLADGHMTGDGQHHDGGEHMEPPSPPPVLAEFIEDIIDEGELTDTAAEMLELLLMTPEERQEAGEPDFDEEDVQYAEEEIEQLFNDLLDEDIDETANGYLNMMLEEMSGAQHHGDGQHHDGGDANKGGQ